MKRKIHVEIDMVVETKESDEDIEELIEAQMDWMKDTGNLFCDWDIDDPEEFDVTITIEDNEV